MKSLLSSALLVIFLTTTAATPIATTTTPQKPITPHPSLGMTVSAPTYTPLSTAEIAALQQALVLAPSESQKQAILFPNVPNANNVTYQFPDHAVTPPTAGTISVASIDVMPGLLGTSIGMGIGFVDACGLNVPHMHPRANEFLTVVEGLLIGGMVLEGEGESAGLLPVVNMTLPTYTGMVFPMGRMHFQFNPTCERAVFAAAFDSNDGGRTEIAKSFFSVYPDEVIIAATGNLEFLGPAQIDQLRDHIPSAFIELIDSCAIACGLQRG